VLRAPGEAASPARAWTWVQALMHSAHSVQVNMRRLRVLGFSRMGQAWSQALLQDWHAAARCVSNPTTMALSLAIHARL
jgi:hypothetical protein